jgi:HEAT repeat protein
MADNMLLSTLAKEYDSKGDAVINERVLNLVRNIHSRDAESALNELAGPFESPSSDPLARAALEGLSHLGTATATDNLLQRLESAPPDRTSDIFNAISQISGTDEGRAQLQYAAMGNKQASGDRTRVAAIYGIGNYPDGETRNFLRRLSQDSNMVIRAATQRTLNKMMEE